MIRFLKNNLWIRNIVLIIGLISISLFAVYSADYSIKLQRNSTKLYLNRDRILLVIPGVYDQYRVFNNTLSYEYLFGLNDSYINYADKSLILNRPNPDTIDFQGEPYYFAKDLDKIQIAPQVSDFNYVDNVAIFSNSVEFNSLPDQIDSNLNQKIKIEYNCNDNIFSHCKDYLKSAKMETKLLDSSNIQIDYTYDFYPGLDPAKISPQPSFNIPKDFRYCDEHGCLAPQTKDNPIKDVDQMPVEIFKDKLLQDKKILKDLDLNAINYNKLSLPDLPPTFNVGVYSSDKPSQTYLKATVGSHQILLNIISPQETDKVIVDYRYSKIKFQIKPCISNPCKLSFVYQIGYK